MQNYKFKTIANPNKKYEGTIKPKVKTRFIENDEFFNKQVLPALDYIEKRFKVKFGDFILLKKIDENFEYVYTSEIDHKQLGLLSLVFKMCGLFVYTSRPSKNRLSFKFELRWETFQGERDGASIGTLIVDTNTKKTLWKDQQ